MKISRFVLLLCLPFLVSFCLAGQARAALSPEALRLILEERVASGANKSLMAALLENGNITYLNAGNAATTASQQEPGADTIFEIGSVTKVFTGVLAAYAVGRHELDLDTAIAAYLPRDLELAAPALKAATPLELATHSSGLPRMPLNWQPSSTADPYADYGEKELLQVLAMPEQNGVEKGTYNYSNYGLGLLGYILERTAGESYATLLRERVTAPLGMKDTAVEPVEASRLAQGHDSSGAPVPPWNFGALAGCGVVDSTVRDLAVFVAANLDDKDVPEDLATALKLARKAHGQGPAEQVLMGLGWHILVLEGERLYFHDGGTGGYRAFVGFMPSRHSGIVLLSNTSTDISDIGLNALLPTIPLRPPLVVVTLPPEVLETYAGRYRFEPGPVVEEATEVVLEREGQGLRYMVPESGERSVLLPLGEDVFAFETTRDAEVRFDRDAQGRVSGLRIMVVGEEMRATRLP